MIIDPGKVGKMDLLPFDDENRQLIEYIDYVGMNGDSCMDNRR